MTPAYFQPAPDGSLEPEWRAHGPWSTDMMHGRLLGGLAARQLERDAGGDGWRCVRLTVDLFRPAAMEAVTVVTHPVRDGRKVRVVDAMLQVDGHAVGRVTGLFVVTAAEPPGTIWRPDHRPWPDPETVPIPHDGTGSKENEFWLFRVVEGGMGSAEQSRVWTCETAELVAGEAVSPLVRAAVTGDIGCPLTNFSDDGLHYINADYTVLLGRYPTGDWIGIESGEQIDADGISAATSRLFDRDGLFAVTGGGSIARPPLHH